ncbi:MAG: DUF1841 family protein [Pseudomonadales bacterium]|nr:DUF1841 family protein [Pseudomonadales bacterium]
MIFGDRNRAQLRASYLTAWRKFRAGVPLEPLEKQIAAVIAEHPEYHTRLEHDESVIDRDFTPETGQPNPFLHMGLHLAIRDQVATNRPAGIAKLHAELSAKLGSVHDAEHRMQEALAASLWEAQRSGGLPDEAAYLERVRRLSTGRN